jgi:uncharacterized membrane protein YkvA (DUF1232 family)
VQAFQVFFQMVLLYVMWPMAVVILQVDQELGQYFGHIARAARFKVEDAQPLAKACLQADIQRIVKGALHFLLLLGYWLFPADLLHFM